MANPQTAALRDLGITTCRPAGWRPAGQRPGTMSVDFARRVTAGSRWLVPDCAPGRRYIGLAAASASLVEVTADLNAAIQEAASGTLPGRGRQRPGVPQGPADCRLPGERWDHRGR